MKHVEPVRVLARRPFLARAPSEFCHAVTTTILLSPPDRVRRCACGNANVRKDDVNAKEYARRYGARNGSMPRSSKCRDAATLAAAPPRCHA